MRGLEFKKAAIGPSDAFQRTDLLIKGLASTTGPRPFPGGDRVRFLVHVAI